MNKYLKPLVLALVCSLCGSISESKKAEAPKVNDIVHYNVVIVPDLSNRLTRSASPSDVAIVDTIVHNIYPTIARARRLTNQKDRYSIVLSSTRLGSLYRADFSKMTIDLGIFGNDQRARIDYLMGRSKAHNFKADVAAFAGEFARIEALARQKTDGADIWSLLNSGIDRNLVIYPEAPFSFNNQQFRNVHRNILILFTDGYIEAGLSQTQGCDGRQCRYLSGQLIKNFRQAYKGRLDKGESLQSFFYRNKYGITAAGNPYLKSFEVLVLEADDRSLTKTGNATVAPTDFEIMKLFWADWMKKSGVQHFEMYPLARDAKEARDNIFSFIGVK